MPRGQSRTEQSNRLLEGEVVLGNIGTSTPADSQCECSVSTNAPLFAFLPFHLRGLLSLAVTIVAIVGMRASCHPIPVLMIVAPAAATSFASVTISSLPRRPSYVYNANREWAKVLPCAPPRNQIQHTQPVDYDEVGSACLSAQHSLKTQSHRTRTTFLMALMVSIGKRIRFAYAPPHSSVRLLVRAAINSLMKYPSDPINSTPSAPNGFCSAWVNHPTHRILPLSPALRIDDSHQSNFELRQKTVPWA